MYSYKINSYILFFLKHYDIIKNKKKIINLFILEETATIHEIQFFIKMKNTEELLNDIYFWSFHLYFSDDFIIFSRFFALSIAS